MATANEAPASNTAEGPISHTPNQLDALAKMAAPFAPSQIAKLPKVTCKDCTRAQYKVCDKPNHKREKCDVCSSNMTSAHIHLDYVGHADLTSRLLEADPLWTWEPMAFDQDGLPKFDHNGGLWIRLTVAGHTRLGYGDSQGKTGPNAVKEAIGDALRNAGMRFGAALDLWSKTDQDKAKAEKEELSREPSREDRLEDLYSLMQKRWGHLEGLRAVKVMVGEELFHESQVHDANGKLRLFGELIDDRIRELVNAEKQAAFMRRMRSGWDTVPGNEESLAEAKSRNLLDVMVPFGPEKVPTRVEDMLATRIAQLKEAAQGGAPENSAGSTASPPPAEGSADTAAHLERLMGQVASQDCWNNPLPLIQIKGDADKHGVLDHQVQGPDGVWLPLRKLLDDRIADLNQSIAARNERGAA